MKQESSPFKKLAIPAVILPFLAPMAAFAAEGTGRVSHIYNDAIMCLKYPVQQSPDSLSFTHVREHYLIITPNLNSIDK